MLVYGLLSVEMLNVSYIWFDPLFSEMYFG